MTKWQPTNSFDLQALKDFKEAEKLQPLVDYVNELADNLGRFARNGVSLTDNLNASTSVLSMTSGVSKSIKFVSRKGTPVAAFVGSQSNTSNPINKFVWRPTATGEIALTVWYDNPTPNSDVTFVFIYS